MPITNHSDPEIVFQEPTSQKPILILLGDVRKIILQLPDDIFQCVVTSPPYWGVRDYGVEGQIGAEPVLEDYINELVTIFSEVRRTLKPNGISPVHILSIRGVGYRFVE